MSSIAYPTLMRRGLIDDKLILAAPTSLSPNFCELQVLSQITLRGDWWKAVAINQISVPTWTKRPELW